MGLFKRKKQHVDLIQFPTLGWKESENSPHLKSWINPEQTAAPSINYFDLKPDLPTVQDINQLRQYYRLMVSQNNGGLIELETSTVNGFQTVRSLFKFPQEPTGMAYIGSLTFPFKGSSYVVKIQAVEAGMTGMRDSVVADVMLSEGMLEINEEGSYEGWFADPYNPDFKEGTLMNKSETRQFDAQFPDHPLSQCRNILDKLEAEVRLDSQLGKLEKF